MSQEESILAYIANHPGAKSREIAREAGLEKKEANRILYGALGAKLHQDRSYGWYLADAAPRRDESGPKTADTLLARVSRYYLDCLDRDRQANISVFASSRYGNLDYAELGAGGSLEGLEAVGLYQYDEARRLLNQARRERNKVIPILAYPVLLKHVRSQRTNWEGYKVEPLFYWQFTQDEIGNATPPDVASELPQLNFQALGQLAGGKGAQLMEEAVRLFEDLGLAERDLEMPEPDDLIARLVHQRPTWPCAETLDPLELCAVPVLSEATREGLYNRAVVMLAERSVYTQGLETELKLLQEVPAAGYRDTALGAWLAGNVSEGPTPRPETVNEVVTLNDEQRQAVARALSAPLTVITGPPGTGKSQVVASILVNAALQGIRVLFASKNNKAVDVVEQRVNSLGPRPVLLRLGKRENQAALAGYLAQLLAASTTEEDRQAHARAERRLADLRREAEGIEKDMDRVVKARNFLDAEEATVEALRSQLGEGLFAKARRADGPAMAATLVEPMARCQAADRAAQALLTRLLWPLLRSARLRAVEDTLRGAGQTLDWLNLPRPEAPIAEAALPAAMDLLKKAEHRCNLIAQAAKYFEALEKLNSLPPIEALQRRLLETRARIGDLSLRAWQTWLTLLPERLDQEQRTLLGNYCAALRMAIDGPGAGARHVTRELDRLFRRVTSTLSCWAVTSLSARGRIPLEPGFFDLLIVDEASQCDIASIVPLLYRAKRAVVIGDPQQLRHISTLVVSQDDALLDQHGLIGSHTNWGYSRNSLFDLAAPRCPTNRTVSLRDHHRSHADIIEFSNGAFYENGCASPRGTAGCAVPRPTIPQFDGSTFAGGRSGRPVAA